MTILYYRMSGQNSSILNRCPKTKEEVNKIKSFKEKEMWMSLAIGKRDEKTLRPFVVNYEKAIKKFVKAKSEGDTK